MLDDYCCSVLSLCEVYQTEIGLLRGVVVLFPYCKILDDYRRRFVIEKRKTKGMPVLCSHKKML